MMPKNILLIEPGYRNKYPPLGLMKLATYHGSQGRGDHVAFIKGESRETLETAWDRVYVTTLFSFEWARTAATIDFAIKAAGNQPERVFVGGIAASLMHPQFVTEPRWAGVRFIKGLLNRAPAVALQLSQEDCEFGADDLSSTPIENLPPDYSILDQVDYRYPVRDAYFGYASRGCVRKCAFCGVPKLEGDQKDTPPLSMLVEGVDRQHGQKRDLILMDNNITASPRYKEVIAEIRDLGFVPGAKLRRGDGNPLKRRVDFNQGVDARILVKSPMFLREMATICIDPLRIAFDHVGLRKVYEHSVRMAAEFGISSLSNYMLYNFMDTPEDLYERMRINIRLNEELGIRIWSFPMRYQPVDLKDRSHVGKHWNRYYLRSFQIILQATRGIVTGDPDFFSRAFGEDLTRFKELLSLPHGFIFYRNYFEKNKEGRAIRDEYQSLRCRLSASQELELISLLSSTRATQTDSAPKMGLVGLLDDHRLDPLIRKTLRFHILDTKWTSEFHGGSRAEQVLDLLDLSELPDEEICVEDAGLFEDNV